MKTKTRCSILLLVSALLISGCAHYPVNAPLRRANPESGYRFQTVARTNSDDLLLMLAFSGGGTRAAALSYGVLEELRKTEVGPSGNEHRLLDDVGLISSVSGGSFTAAYYALWGDRIFTDFEPRFLKKHVQTGLLLRVLAPWNGIRLASPGFGRSDLAAEYYDRLLFDHATFGDLMASHGRPFLSVKLFKEVMTRASRERSDSLGKVSNCQPPEIDAYIIELHFRQLANESDRRFFNSLRTSLQLPSKTVDRLRELAARELSGKKEFKRLVADLRSQANKPHSPNGQSLASGVRDRKGNLLCTNG